MRKTRVAIDQHWRDADGGLVTVVNAGGGDMWSVAPKVGENFLISGDTLRANYTLVA